MIVLGISPLDKDATVSLMVDGEIVFAVAEERLSRQKMHAGFPHRAIEQALSYAGITAADLDYVAYAFWDWQRETQLMQRNRQRDFDFNRQNTATSLQTLLRTADTHRTSHQTAIPGLADPSEGVQRSGWKRWLYAVAAREGRLGAWTNRLFFDRWLRQASQGHRRDQQALLAGLRGLGLADKLRRFDHHDTHVANAFYCSGFERALVFTVDAYGSGLSATVSLADRQGRKRLAEVETPYSLGAMYEAVTWGLGYLPDRHAGKIVGLAAYGDPEVLGDLLRAQFSWDDGTFRIRRSSNLYLGRYLATRFPKIDVAAAYQRVLEETVSRQVAHFVKQTGVDAVVLSGGVTANVKMNQRVHEVPGVEHIYIHPNMGDGGCASGAAILQAWECGQRTERLESVLLGPEYSVAEMERALADAQLPWDRPDPIEEEMARLLAENRVVARFTGRLEYGPRALGNRSILYPAQDPDVNQWLNEQLGRTEFMPFAPATLAADQTACYHNTQGAEFAAQFMTITFDCTEEMRRTCPAAVHVDGTARPQLVTETSNPSLHRVLLAYQRRTGISSIINTSFNMHEEPIVCTPQDAVRAFLAGRMDFLALGPFLVKRPD